MSSYIRLEILLFFRAFETGVGMLVVYRLTDMLKRRLFCDRMWNSTVDILYWLLAGLLLFTALYQCNYGRIRFFMLAGVAFGGIFANFVLNYLSGGRIAAAVRLQCRPALFVFGFVWLRKGYSDVRNWSVDRVWQRGCLPRGGDRHAEDLRRR